MDEPTSGLDAKYDDVKQVPQANDCSYEFDKPPDDRGLFHINQTGNRTQNVV
ncbi:hypothetical protein [Paenibacillus sp. CECT 9249]|uniref:hypothetical protein n=1 Tax=Paenibacillus sp. CECT 9249 TaxID=2845385 RepID=UPI001E3D0C2C|nr:hypothetical protein [Paenibacillus sp. CECT 9249]